MRILMLNNEFPPLGGGTGTVNAALLRRFARVPGLQIDLITSALGLTTECETFSDTIRIFKVPVNNKNIHHSSNRELLTYAGRALLSALHFHHRYQYDLCFAWSAVPAGGVALALHQQAGLRYIVRVCGPDIPGFEQRYSSVYFALAPVIRAIWRGSERVIAKCQGEADMICTIDNRPNIILVSNGVDLDGFLPAAPVDNDGPLRLLCVGRLIERKGQHYLIEAVKRLTDEGINVTLTLIGTGDAQTPNQQQADHLGIAERVHFLGYVPREEIAAHYSAAHVFVLPSYNEGMSVATLEALAAGLPVVVTRTGGTAELVTEGENGLVFEWADIDTLTTHLRTLAHNRALVRQMSRAACERATNFSWDTAAARYLELFAELTEYPITAPDGAISMSYPLCR